MKTYYIYYFDVEKNLADTSCYEGIVHNALSVIDALKKWHIFLNSNYSYENYFRNSTYEAVPVF